MNWTDELKARWAYIATIALIGVIFFSGYWMRGCLDHSGVTSDTTVVAKPITPPADTGATIPATTEPPKEIVKWRTRPDTASAREAAEMRVFVNQVIGKNDSLLAERDSMRTRLTTLLSPHYGIWNFQQPLDSTGILDGTFGMKYTPMTEKFDAALKWNKIVVPMTIVTNTKKPAWWVEPAVFVGGAATAYFVQKENSTGALIAGGASLFIIIVEF